jgi:hypothetical protein
MRALLVAMALITSLCSAAIAGLKGDALQIVQACCLEKTHQGDHAHPSRRSREREKYRPLLRLAVASVPPRAAPQAVDCSFSPGSLPLGAACSISALISPPIRTKRPVTYIQVSSTMTAPILP